MTEDEAKLIRAKTEFYDNAGCLIFIIALVLLCWALSGFPGLAG